MDENSGGYEAAQTAGAWLLDIDVNEQTSITCAALPFFDPARPLRGTKPARVFTCLMLRVVLLIRSRSFLLLDVNRAGLSSETAHGNVQRREPWLLLAAAAG